MGVEQHSEAIFRDLFDRAPDATFVTDAAGLIVLANRRAEDLFGYSLGDLIGQPVDMLVPERLRAAHREHERAYRALPVSRAVDPTLEPVAQHRDGTEFPVGISLSPVETPDGLLVLASVRDISDRERVEAARGRYTARLVKRIRDDEQADLEAQLHQAQRLESIGQLAGGIAHDFNNLLAGIMNYAGLVATSLDDEMRRHDLSNDEAFVTLAQDVDEITNVAKRAAALTHQLLIFSRRKVVHTEVLDLNAVVGDLEGLLRRTIGENVDHLRTVLAPDLPLIRADRGQIDQVLMNLVVNARDAMPGGGELEIETAVVEVDEDYARPREIEPGTYVLLKVSDSGVGMSQDVAERAFEPFFTTKPKGEGTGLGLATVYGIVAQAGGEVSIYSERGLGTTVRVHLPATSEQPGPPRVAKASVPTSRGGETVLLVEDEVIVRDPARRLLMMHGYSVLDAGTADQALAVLDAHPGKIDLLLTDVVMPERSGKELSEEVLRRSPMTKVLFMSGYSHDVIVHQGVPDEGVSRIEKPFSADDLLRKVREILDGGT